MKNTSKHTIYYWKQGKRKAIKGASYEVAKEWARWFSSKGIVYKWAH